MHKSFDKDYKKLPHKIKEAFKVRRNIFIDNTYAPILHNHKLRGEFNGFRSINITSDIRAIYYEVEPGTYIFVRIGTHSELYK